VTDDCAWAVSATALRIAAASATRLIRNPIIVRASEEPV
jgi:hypothetical protein